MAPRYVLGVAAFYHDSSACLLCDGVVVAAAQEERFTRLKHDENFPEKAVDYCLQEGGITVSDLEAVVFYEKPLLKFERLLQTYIRHWPRGFFSFAKAMRTWLGGKLWTESVLRKKLHYRGEIFYVPHHIGHAASSYYASGFDESLVLTLDGVGEWDTTTLGTGKGSDLQIHKTIHYPDSLGLFYSAFTYYLGFKVNSGEYKLMGLAPYGTPKYTDKILEMIEVFEDGSFRLRPQFFAYSYSLRMINNRFINHFGRSVRQAEDPMTQWHKDMAASIQRVTEDIILRMVKQAQKDYPHISNLCLSGGVALNCTANGRVLRESGIENLYIFPASGDAGGSVGAALYYENLKHKLVENTSVFPSIYLGPSFSDKDIKDFLQSYGVLYKTFENRAELIAQMLDQDQVVGLFQGRMEFGPRALGNRSIIADPRQKHNWKRVNLKIKFRESFRPFAPSTLAETASETFDLRGVESPYMLLTAQTIARDLPAITHVDRSARIQTVTEDQNKPYWDILKAFETRTGCGTVINTSFNVRGEPIVCTPEDAFKCFVRTDMDVLVLENFYITADMVDKKELRNILDLPEFEED